MHDTQTVSSAPHPGRVTFDTAALWALVGALFLSAILFIPSATLPFIFSKVVVIALGSIIALACYILARLLRGNIVVPPLSLLGALWLVPAAYLLSALFAGGSIAKAIAGTEFETDTFAFVLLLAIVAGLAALAFRRGSQYRIFFKAGIVLAALVLIAQLAFFVLGITDPARYSATANVVGSFTDLGMFVGLGVTVMQLALRFLVVPPRTRQVIWALIALSLVVLAVVNSTLIWVLVALTAFGLFVEAILRRRSPHADEDFDGVEEVGSSVTSVSIRRDGEGIAPSLITLVVALFFLIGGQTIGASLTNTFGAGYLDVRPSWESTFAVGSHSYASSPLFGTGPGTFGQDWLKFRDPSINDSIFWNIDFTSGIGYIPTAFISTGIIGALAWLIFLGLFLFIGIRALLFRAPEDAFIRFTAVSTFIGACYVFVLAIFAVPGPVMLAAGFVMVGIFISTLRYAGKRHEWGIIFSRNPRVGFVIVFMLTILLLASVVAAYAVIERYLGSVAYAEAANDLAAGNIDGATAAINRSLVFTRSERAYQLATNAGIAQMQAVAANTTLSPAEAQQQFQTALSGSIAAAKEAVSIDANNYKNWMALASVYQVVVPLKIDGAYQNASAAYAQAAKLNPSSPLISYEMAQLDLANSDLPSAEKDLIQAISQKHDYAQAIFLLSQVQVQEGKAKDALQTAEAAKYFAPNDPDVLFQVGILRSGTGDQAGAASALEAAVAANPSFANARFFLAVVYAGQGDLAGALKQIQAIAALSQANATAVAPYITALNAGKNPFPQSALGALGVAQPSVTDTSTSTAKTEQVTK